MRDKKVIFRTTNHKRLMLKWYAHKKNKTFSDVLNEAIDEYIKKYDVEKIYNEVK